MRHLRSILYALVLAPAAWILTGVGFTDGLHGRARQYSEVESFTGLLLLLLAGATYAILVFAPISPAGPALAGLIFFGAGLWALSSPSSYGDLWSAGVTKPGFDLSRPGYGLAVLLAVPLLCTALSARRWARYEPPQLPLIGTVWRPRGAAKAPGTPVESMTTAVMRQPAEAMRPAAEDAMPAADATQVLPPMSSVLADEQTAVVIFIDEPTEVVAAPDERTEVVASPDEPTEVVASPDEPTEVVASVDEPTEAHSSEEPTVVAASEESMAVGGLEERPVPDDVVEETPADAPGEGPTADVAAEGPTVDVAAEQPTADVEEPAEPATEDVSAKAAATDDEPTQIAIPVVESPAKDEPEAVAAEPEAAEPEAAEPEAVESEAVAAEPEPVTADLEAAAEPEAAPAAEPDPRPIGEETAAIPTDDQDRTQIIRLPVGEYPTRNFNVTPGDHTQVISHDRMDETQVIRLPTQRTDSFDGERTQVIRPGAGTVDPPGDRTQVIRIPSQETPRTDEHVKSPEPSRPPSIIAQERPDPGADPTTRLVPPPTTNPGEETTLNVGNGKRAMTVMNLERPADETADDTRPLILPKREDQTTEGR